MWGLYQDLIALQREIYLSFANRIGTFAVTGDWSQLAVYLPMGILFGAAHALTPGHSKAALATYIAGSMASMPRALATSLMLSFTHVTVSVLIVLLSLPLIRFGFGAEAGRAPALELISRGLLIAVAIWMLWQALRATHSHKADANPMFGVMAGLIPCPLTLFVMTFAVSRGVPQAGVAFATVMMAGVATVLSIVALASVAFRTFLISLVATRPTLLDRSARTMQGLGGVLLLALALSTSPP